MHFRTKMTRLLSDGDTVAGIVAVDLNTGTVREFKGPVILATGHSARDVYRYFSESGVEIEAKAFIAIGVRAPRALKANFSTISRLTRCMGH